MSENNVSLENSLISRVKDKVLLDPVGNTLLANAAISASLGHEWVALNFLSMGIYHIKEISKLVDRNEQLLTEAAGDERKIARLDNVFDNVRGNLSKQYTRWLYGRSREKIINEDANKSSPLNESIKVSSIDVATMPTSQIPLIDVTPLGETFNKLEEVRAKLANANQKD